MLYYYRYRLLAFIVAHKRRRQNSCLYKSEKKYLVAKELSISVNTYSSYLKKCLELGYCKKYGNGYQFVKLYTILNDLFEGDLKYWKNVRFFKGSGYQGLNFKEILSHLEFEAADVNFRQQEYRQEQINDVIDFLENRTHTGGAFKRFKKLMKNLGCASAYELLSKLKNQATSVRTGKYHISNLLGFSSSTGANRLRKWSDLRFIKREVIKKFIPMYVSYESFDELKRTHKVVVPCTHGFLIIQGSKITRPQQTVEIALRPELSTQFENAA